MLKTLARMYQEAGEVWWGGGFFELIGGISLRSGVGLLLGFLIAHVYARPVIKFLTNQKAQQPIRNSKDFGQLAEVHGKKSGTPTFGGMIILLGYFISYAFVADLQNNFIWFVNILILIGAVVGMVDDYQKIKYKNSKGLSARNKLLLTAGAYTFAFIIMRVLLAEADRTHMGSLNVPFIGEHLTGIPVFLQYLAGLFIYLACINSVNITDGLDGLAIGIYIVVISTLTLLCYFAGNVIYAEHLQVLYHRDLAELTVACCCLLGAAIAFLWQNCYPARIFMGDMGSLALGSSMAGIATCLRQEIILIIIAGVFVVETISVILQVGSFKLIGKRIFRMAPLHHHFEIKGLHESKIIIRMWIAAVFLCVMSLLTLRIHF